MDCGLEVTAKFARHPELGARVELRRQSCSEVAMELRWKVASPAEAAKNWIRSAAAAQPSTAVSHRPQLIPSSARTRDFRGRVPCALQ